MNPYDKARELRRAIEESEQYKKYLEAKKNLEADEQVKSMVDDFHQRQFDLQKRQLLGEEIQEAEQEKLQELLGILTMNPQASSYLQAEFSYGQMMNEISEILAEMMEQ